MIKLGRNAPCPCGSGKKYKKCCLDKDDAFSTPPFGAESDFLESDEMKEFASFADFTTPPTIKEVREKLNAFTRSHNETGIDDFLGLSPSQMHELIHNPIFTKGSGLELNPDVPLELLRAAPAVKMSEFILRKLSDAGTVKATAERNNLPRSIASEFNECYMECMLTKEEIEVEREYLKIRSESDARFLTELKFILQHCGWMKLRDGVFSVTKRGAEIAENGFSLNDFEKLIRFHVVKFEWESLPNGSPLTSHIQNLVPFLLYALTSFDSDAVPHEELATLFAKAFPQAIESAKEIPITAHIPVTTLVQMECEVFYLIWFASFFGLVKSYSGDRSGDSRRQTIYRKTELFHKLLLWNFDD